MKNKFKSIFKILIVTAGCLWFASFSPSLDGRAVVVDGGVFPQGLFAKTVGYLPGDIISVTNITGDSTVDILVIGALDPSEGVAIMLSPEAAQAIGIDKTTNNIVKITKRSGQDERVYGNAVITKSNADNDDFDDEGFETIGAEENSDAFEELKAEEPEAFEEESEAEPETEPEMEAAEELTEAEETEEAPFEEEEAEPEAEEQEELEAEEAPENEFEAEETEEEPEEEGFEEEEFDDEELDELPAEEEAFEEEQPEALEEPEEEPAEEEAEPEETAEPEEETEEEPEPEEFEEEAEEEAFDEEQPEALEEAPAEEAFEDEQPEALAEDLPEEETLADEFIEEPETPAPEETLEENLEPAVEPEVEEPSEETFEEDELEALEDLPSEEAGEEYEAIVLVPTDSNPPENEDDEVEDLLSNEVETTEIVEEVRDITEEGIDEKTVTVEETETNKVTKTNSSDTSYEKYIVPNLASLESGKYYIQIAVFSDDDNINEIVSMYGANYPITIVPMAGSARKQILIGPVTMDEYKVVLERFKSYGFKDAFLRKIK